jgi:hypothetical protein
MEILLSFKWPITVIVCFAIFAIILKAQIRKIFGSAKGFKIDAAGFKFQTQDEKSVALQEKTAEHIKDTSLIENATKIFRMETLNLFTDYVKTETKYDTLATDGEKFKRLLDYSVILYIIRRFEIIYDNIFGSQIALLQALNSLGPQENTLFQHYYNQAKEKYKDAYETFSVEMYPKFLFSSQLIYTDTDQKIQISILGIDFLKYLMDTKKNIFKDL